MRLYEAPRRSFVRIKDDDTREIFFLDHVDGMYSLCKREDGSVVHLSATMEVEVIEMKERPIGYES